jgi:hypothetical protein
MLSVLRRPQTEADRGAASQYALQFVDSPSIEGVRTDSIRLLAQSSQDRGIVLVPVTRYVPRTPPLPADTPPEVRRTIERPPIENALCLYQLDIDGGGVACRSTADVREGRAWMMLGHRSFWLVPDGVATVRSEYADHAPIETAVHQNVGLFTAPQAETLRTTFLDNDGKAVRTIEQPRGEILKGPAAKVDPPASGATHTGAISRVALRGEYYELLVRAARPRSLTVVLDRPACAGRRHVSEAPGSVRGEQQSVVVHPSLGDFHRAHWCPGTYRGAVRVNHKRVGTFSFRVPR